jgi:cell division protein ZapA (FtsZ GTPase activity inhibitor)
MHDDKIDIVINGRKMTIEMEGLSQLEVSRLANMVDERMQQIAKDSKIVDSSKLAILAALDIAAELDRLKVKYEDFDSVETRHVDKMTLSLEKSLEEES